MYRRKSFASSCLTNSLLPQAAVMQMAQASENTGGHNQLKNRLSGTIDHGACQGTCRLSHAAKGCLSVACEAIVTTDSRSGLRVTAPTGVQSRVQRDQRAGLRSRARTYTS